MPCTVLRFCYGWTELKSSEISHTSGQCAGDGAEDWVGISLSYLREGELLRDNASYSCVA